MPLMLRASERRRRNQVTMATLIGRYPPRLVPTAIMKKVRKKPTAPSIRLKSRKPAAKMTIPTRMSARGPKRSVSQPWIGPRMPLSARAIEKAADSMVLLQPNSSRSSTA
jgi:hypothetical protein